MGTWFRENWFDILTIAIGAGTVLFAALTIREDTESRRVSNLITLTVNHRELWSKLFKYPELGRILDALVSLTDKPVTLNESLLVGMVVQHLNATYEALKSNLSVKADAIGEDVRSFFSLPIPKAVWENTKRFQNDDFVAFVEKCRGGSAR